MKRRDLFRGLAWTIIALAVKPLAGLVGKKPMADYPVAVLPPVDYYSLVKTPYSDPVEWDSSLGAGVLDTVKAVNGRSIEANSDLFYKDQYVSIYPADMSYARGTRRVQASHEGFITFDSNLPGDTAVGDLLLLGDKPPYRPKPAAQMEAPF